MKDILFWEEDAAFSYRVAGLLVQDGRMLFQGEPGDEGLAIPGGHVAYDETAADALARELREELGVEVRVGSLRAVAENFFPWRGRTCHQICLYYDVTLAAGELPQAPFDMLDEMAHGKARVRFRWVPLAEVAGYTVYPPQMKQVIQEAAGPVRHFVYRQEA